MGGNSGAKAPAGTSGSQWEEIRIDSWGGFLETLEPYLDGYSSPPTYVFRGQPDAKMLLEPSLLRLLRGVSDLGEAVALERLLEEEFREQAPLFPETQGVWPGFERKIELWSYMQHHSCPTRLLDWTASAFVATYFAVCHHFEKDGAVFAVGAHVLDEDFSDRYPDAAELEEKDFIDPASPERVKFLWPALRSRRVVAQQGHFSVNVRLLGSHDRPILDACARRARSAKGILQQRLIIPAKWKLPFLQALRAMNIAPHALFPDLDGLGRSLADVARLHVARDPSKP